MIHSDDFKEVAKEMQRAIDKHPKFPTDVVKMVSLVSEESGEAVREANLMDEGEGSFAALKLELYQTIQVSFRALNAIREVYDA